jgi:hypothetical protein
MPLLEEIDLVLDVDGVLRGQGAVPSVIRRRSPQLVQLAERALEEGRPLLRPQALYQYDEVEALQHETLRLKGGTLQGGLIAQHLAGARQIVTLVCTIGSALSERVTALMGENILYALALDGVGSAAVEALANAACKYLEDQAATQGWQTTIPLSPGMVGWAVDEGQPQIFELVDASELGVTLTEGNVMLPLKSLSMVLGIGPELQTGGRPCDYCSMRETCRYQDHYEPIRP